MTTNKRRILFLDRDGTLIIEPEDLQIDSLEKLELVDGVIPALLKLKAAGYEFVIVSNQDGLGTDSNPLENFQPPHDKMLSLFASQGINFVAEHIDPHFESDNSAGNVSLFLRNASTSIKFPASFETPFFIESANASLCCFLYCSGIISSQDLPSISSLL